MQSDDVPQVARHGGALENPARRRVRGLAPQWLLVLFMLVGENVPRIRTWQERSDAAEGE